MTKHFKARIEKPTSKIHAMSVWFEAPNIVSAAAFLVEQLGPIGVTDSQVTQLIEVDAVTDEEVRRAEKKVDRTRRPQPSGSRMRGSG